MHTRCTQKHVYLLGYLNNDGTFQQYEGTTQNRWDPVSYSHENLKVISWKTEGYDGFNSRKNWTKFQMIPPTHKAVSWNLQVNLPVIKVNSVTTNRKCVKLHERAPYPEEDSSIDNKTQANSVPRRRTCIGVLISP
jgi:hypothetical protein